MLNSIRNIIEGFCVCVITLSGLFIVIPKGKMEKSVRFVFGIIIICCFLSLLLSFKANDIPKTNIKEKVTVDESESVKKIATEVFELTLKNNSVNFSKIDVIIDKSKKGSISIIRIDVYSDDNPIKIKKLLSSNASYEVNVINE